MVLCLSLVYYGMLYGALGELGHSVRLCVVLGCGDCSGILLDSICVCFCCTGWV